MTASLTKQVTNTQSTSKSDISSPALDAIELKNVQFTYGESPGKPVLDIRHWRVPQSSQLFIHGPSGCGKSTLLNIISGMLLPNQGEIRVLGERLDKLKAHKRDQFRANHIGYVFQQFNLIPYLSATENVQLSQSFANAKDKHANHNALDILSRLNIDSETAAKPSSRLSIGQQQRVAIARAIINEPEVLIADEPTSSLDMENRDNFMHMLLPLAKEKGITLIVVSHDMALASYFEQQQTIEEINKAGAR